MDLKSKLKQIESRKSTNVTKKQSLILEPVSINQFAIDSKKIQMNSHHSKKELCQNNLQTEYDDEYDEEEEQHS